MLRADPWHQPWDAALVRYRSYHGLVPSHHGLVKMRSWTILPTIAFCLLYLSTHRPRFTLPIWHASSGVQGNTIPQTQIMRGPAPGYSVIIGEAGLLPTDVLLKDEIPQNSASRTCLDLIHAFLSVPLP